jgi:hypothetical protein
MGSLFCFLFYFKQLSAVHYYKNNVQVVDHSTYKIWFTGTESIIVLTLFKKMKYCTCCYTRQIMQIMQLIDAKIRTKPICMNIFFNITGLVASSDRNYGKFPVYA